MLGRMYQSVFKNVVFKTSFIREQINQKFSENILFQIIKEIKNNVEKMFLKFFKYYRLQSLIEIRIALYKVN